MSTFYKINGIPFEDYYIPYDLYTYGGLWTWGYNNQGQLGDNSVTYKSSPVQTVAYGTNWKSVSCNGSFNASIKDNSEFKNLYI